MSTRTYRVVVRGFFDGLDDAQRSRLRDRAVVHDLFSSAFTDEGTLTYDATVSAFSHRVTVHVDSGPDEVADAHAAGELSAMERLDAEGLGYRRLRSTVTCMDDVKIRRSR